MELQSAYNPTGSAVSDSGCVLRAIEPTGRVSKEGNMNPTTISIHNLARFGVDVIWVSPTGMETLIDSLEPHTKLKIHSFLGHVTRVRHREKKIDLAEVLVRHDHPGIKVSECMVVGHDPLNATMEQNETRINPNKIAARKELRRRRTGRPHLRHPDLPKDLTCVQYLVGATDASRSGRARAMAVKFQNFFPFPVELRSDTKATEGGTLLALDGGKHASITTYAGHRFRVSRAAPPHEELLVLTMHEHQRLYQITDSENVDDPLHTPSESERTFREEYHSATGRHWLAPFPRPPTPELFIWPAGRVGEVHSIRPRLWRLEQSLTVLSVAPRVLYIENLLTIGQCEYIISKALKEGLKKPGGGNDQEVPSSVSLSYQYQESPVLDSVYRQFADVLQMNDTLMRGHAEPMEVTRFQEGEGHQPRHDFSGDSWRFCSLVIYLQPALEGGATIFPRAFGDKGMQVRPKAGSAVLFYSSMEDGNIDDLMSFEAGRVAEGEKWIANLRISNVQLAK